MKLSACMIMKNEESNLPRCLDSIKSVVDEIVIVDTGSTDKSVEIAESCGAKVYHHKWQDDFSLHRNQAFDYATGDWCLVIDCDEELLHNGLPADVLRSNLLTNLLRLPKTQNALVITMDEKDRGFTTSWLGIRFFRASSNPEYHHAIHNKVRFEGYAAGSDIRMRHYGYSLPAEQMKEKFERTQKILRQDLEKNPDDYRAMFYMAQIAWGEKRFDDVFKFGNRCLELLPIEDGKEMQMYSPLYLWLGFSYLVRATELPQGSGDQLKYTGHAIACAEKGLEFFPNDIDLHYLMAHIGFMANNEDMFYPSSKKYMKLYKNWSHLGFKSKKGFKNIIDASQIANRATYMRNPIARDRVREWIRTFKEAA